MIIGVDAREIQGGVVTGIGRSLINFINYFEKYDTQNTLVLFSEKLIPLEFKENIKRVEIKKTVPTFIWDQIVLPMKMSAAKIDLFYSPYYKTPLCTRVPVVNQVLDLMYLVFEPYKKRLGIPGRLYYATFGKAFSKKAISIITDSDHAKNDIIKLWNINSGKIKVFPLGSSSRYVPVDDKNLLSTVKTRLNLPEKYILYLGNFKPHKNVESLVKSFKNIYKQIPDYKLVLAGPLDSNGIRIKDLVLQENIAENVLFTDTIREGDCPEAIFSMAEIFVCPTLYEGFGLPPLEAMSCGTPVIASNLTAVPEVVGNAGILINPLDINEMSAAILDLIRNQEKKDFYSQKGLERSKQFSEDHTAGKIYNHLISLLEAI